MVIAMTAMTAATSAVRPWAARALFGLRRFDDAGWRARAYSYLSWDVYASARATTEKLVPWFAGEE